MDDDHPAWVWLKDLHDRGDHQTLEEMVDLWKSAQTLGRAGNIIRKGIVLIGKVLLWFAAMFAGWAAVTGELGKYIGRQSGGS